MTRHYSRINNFLGINKKDFEMFYFCFFKGCTCDDTELPHHVSSRDEIASLMTSSKDLLEQIGGKITVVTVARSSLDDFCPKDQVRIGAKYFSLIENCLKNCLFRVFIIP